MLYLIQYENLCYRLNMSFNLNRLDNFPTQHEEHKTPVTADILEAGFITSFIILVISFLIVIPGFRGNAVGSFLISLN